MSTESKKVRVRFAPSPTGYLHLGGVRTALYNYLFAKQHGGDFILRIEDTDRVRYIAEAEDYIIQILDVFGLKYDEGPIRQSERLEIYQKKAHELMEQGLAYPSFINDEELKVLHDKAEAEGKIFRFDASFRTEYDDEAKQKIAAGTPYSIRFKMPLTGTTVFEDLIRGKVEIDNSQLEDLVLLKSDGYPTYNFANIVDDHDMNITHVIRGDEFVSSTPKHVLLYQALGWQPPIYAHLSPILGKSGSKLSKREGANSALEYPNKGYLVEALINFIAFLGWHPSKSEQEIFGLEDLIKEFKLEDVQKAGSVFDTDKLNWFQRMWVVKLYEETKESPERHPLYIKIKELFGDISDHDYKVIWPFVVDRLNDPEEYPSVAEEFNFFFQEPEYDPSILVWKKSDAVTTKNILKKVYEFLANLPDSEWGRDNLEKALKEFIAQNNTDNGSVLWPLRVSLTGKEKSMGPFEILAAMQQMGKKDLALARVEKASQ